MTGPTLDERLRASVAQGLAAIDWESRCARAEEQRDEARDLVKVTYIAMRQKMPARVRKHINAAKMRWLSEARGDDAPSPTAGSGGGLATGSQPRFESPAHHTPASDDDRVIIVLTRGEALALSGHLQDITRLLGDELAQSFDATAAVHGSHSAGAAFQPPVRSGAIDDADTPLAAGELNEIEDAAVARHMEGAAVDITPWDVLRLVAMARPARPAHPEGAPF